MPLSRRVRLVRGSDVKIKRVLWVMLDWLPCSSLTLLAGREGLGKSTLAAQICADITNGTLEGVLHDTPRNIVYVHTEDSREHTVAPRLKAAGADMDRVFFIDVETETTDSGTLILPLDIDQLENQIRRIGAAIVVLDAATSSMSSVLAGKDDRDVRQFLEPLARLADRCDCVVLGLCHFGKRDSTDTGKLILGSIAWSQVPRSVLSIAKDDESGTLVVTNTKANLAPRIRSMAAEIVSTTVQTEDGPTEVGVLTWIGETDRDARDLLAGPDTEAGDGNAARAFILDYLMRKDIGGEASASDILKAGRAAGFNDNELKHARSRSKRPRRIVSRKSGMGSGWVWAIDTGNGEGTTKVPKVPHARDTTPSAPSEAPSSPIESPDWRVSRPRCPQCSEEHDDPRPFRVCQSCIAAGRWPTDCAICGKRLPPNYHTTAHLPCIRQQRKQLEAQ